MPRIVKRTTVTETFDDEGAEDTGADSDDADSEDDEFVDDLADAKDEAKDALRRPRSSRECARETDRSRRR